MGANRALKQFILSVAKTIITPTVPGVRYSSRQMRQDKTKRIEDGSGQIECRKESPIFLVSGSICRRSCHCCFPVLAFHSDIPLSITTVIPSLHFDLSPTSRWVTLKA